MGTLLAEWSMWEREALVGYRIVYWRYIHQPFIMVAALSKAPISECMIDIDT